MDERKSPRLEGYDYSRSGYYFVTVCTRDRRPYLRETGYDIQKGDGKACCRRGAQCAPAPLPSLTRAGEIAERALLQIPAHYPGVAVDKYVVMPNHIHLILTLPCDGGRALRAPTVSRIIRAWKETVTKTLGTPIWQKSFYDHIICDENDYLRIWNYIDTNPLQWAEDEYYTALERG